MSTSKCN